MIEPTKRPMHLKSYGVHQWGGGWGKAWDPATRSRIYLSVGVAPMSNQTAFLHKVHRSRKEALRYSGQHMARMRRLVVAALRRERWLSVPWWKRPPYWLWKRIEAWNGR